MSEKGHYASVYMVGDTGTEEDPSTGCEGTYVSTEILLLGCKKEGESVSTEGTTGRCVLCEKLCRKGYWFVSSVA